MTDVEIGMIFERQDMIHSRWVVDEIVPIHGIAHVTLCRLDAPAEVKLLAATAVSNDENYCIVTRFEGIVAAG
ncbi:MAG: hypothetical protein H7840_16605 [Alphaproteobacteria bacterium]